MTVSAFDLFKIEVVRRDEPAVRDGLAHIWAVMQECVHQGCAAEGVTQARR
jgi:L-serine deaminase